MADTADASPKCQFCGQSHLLTGRCPQVQAVEYYENGTVKRVEYVQPVPVTPWPSPGVISIDPLTAPWKYYTRGNDYPVMQSGTYTNPLAGLRWQADENGDTWPILQEQSV